MAVVVVGRRHHLRGAGGAGAERHQETDRLQQRQPLGLLHVGGLGFALPIGRSNDRADSEDRGFDQ